MLAVRIQLRSIPGGWRASVGHVDARPVETDLSGDRVANAAKRIGVLLTPPAVLTTDARRSRDEEEAGSELASLFDAPATQAALHALLGEARGAGHTALLLVDAEEADVRALPWELFGAGGALEARGDAVIARLVRGRPAASTEPGDAFTVVLGSPDPKDALCSTRLAELRGRLDALGVAHVPLDGPVPEGLAVLHLVAHGRVDDAEAQILAPGGSQGAGTAAHGLVPLLERVQLVVLDVCDAGSTATDEHAVPGARLVDAGAPAVVAPSTRLGLEAARAFSDGLYAALAEGGTIAGAVAEGRRAVRALGRPHPDSRWANPVLHVAGAQAARAALRREGWRPEGWAPQPPEVAALLTRARELAAPHGFVGFEHLLAAWPDAGGGPYAAHLRYLLAHQPDPRQRLGALQPRVERDEDFRGTARIRALAPGVAGLEDLARRLWSDLDGAIAAFFGVPSADPDAEGTATLDPGALGAGLPSAATGLEVLGGPEDGRRFGPGDTIGRESPSVPGLYGDTRLADPYLSRKALAWEQGPVLLKAARRRTDTGWVPAEPGPLALRVGDQIALTAATLLRAT